MKIRLQNIVGAELIKLGYRQGKGANWYKDFSELIHVVGLYKSRWGGEYYIEAGVWLKTFGAEERPRYLDCHVRLRLDNACGLDVGNLSSALFDEDQWKMDSIERGQIIARAVQNTEALFFNKVQTLVGLRQQLHFQKKPAVLVKREAHQLLGSPAIKN